MEQNKNKTFLLIFGLLLMLSLAFAISGCVPPVPEVIEVTGVDIVEDDQSIKVDETMQLTAVVTPEDATNKTVAWESDNSDVATVDENGLVTALKSGTANITVTTENGAFTDTIKITVTKPYTPSAPAPTVKKYKVSFQVIDGIPAGINSRNGVSNDFSGFKIEIFTDAERNTKKTDTLTDVEGKASLKLPNGEYWFRISKEGYADYPPENNDLSVQRTPQQGYFEVNGADVDVTNDSPIFMIHVYNVTIADVVGGTATVTATPDTDVQHLKNVTVNISGIESGKEFSSIEVVGSNSASTILTTTVTAGIEYTFSMPTENVTVTLTLKDAGCPQAGYIYNGSDYADDWMIGVSSIADHIEFSKDGEHLFLKAFQLVDDYKNDRLIGYSTNHDNKAYISKCINSIEINWENTGTDSDHNKSYLFVATSPGGNYDNSDVALLTRECSFNRTTDTLDVSGLTSDTYYIGVIAKVLSWGTENDVSEIKVHSIKLSENTVVPE